MNETGYAVLKIPKTGAAFAYAKEARDFATGATGAGGYLHATATAKQWSDVRFVSAIREVSDGALPVSIGASYSDLYTGLATVIGGTTPIGDLRSEDGGYITVGSSTLYHTKKSEEYNGAFYATYIGGTNSSPTKIGIGTTAGDISTSGYYEGSFTTNNIHEFQTSFDADSTDLSKITTGSGVYTEGADVTLQFNILNRNGEQLSSAAQIAADPFVSGQKISILNTDGTVAFTDYRIGGDSTFTFSSSQNIDVFGSFTRNFGIRNQVVNQDGGVHTSEFYLYANTATFDKVFVSSSGQTVLNETYSNHNPPNTGTITSAADRADAIKYFNNQPINDSGVTGFIEFDLGFNESPNFTSLGDLVLFYGTSGDFTTNRGSLVGNFPLNSVQEGQRIRLTANDGIPEGTGLFFKLAADTEVGFNEELFNVGPFTLEPTVEGPDLNLYNQGDQLLVGDFTIEGGLDGDDADGGNLNVSGNALGTGIGGRLTGPDSKMYLLSGDAAGTESDTLQTVTNRGNTTTNDIEIQGSAGVSFNGDSDLSIKPDTVENDTLTFGVKVRKIEGGYIGIGSTSNTMELFPTNSVTVGAGGTIVGASPATGSAILAGTGNIISGHFNTLVGGAQNRISGDLLGFNFIGGGSGIDIVNSQYSSSVGGKNNDVSGADHSVILGGNSNYILTGQDHFLGGGSSNRISGTNAGADFSNALVGGTDNEILNCQYSFIGAGASNTVFSSNSVIGGGNSNIASGDSSVVFGGTSNYALADKSVAAGSHSRVLAAHNGAFVFSDSNSSTTLSTGANTMVLNFAGGLHVPTIGYFGEGLHVSGVPVLTGENNPAEADTLQTVTNRGNVTTTSIKAAHISGSNLTLGNGVTDASIQLDGDFGGGDLTLQNLGSNQDIFFKVNDGGVTTTPFTIQGSTSNVGIHTTNPSTKFHLGSGIARFQNAGSNYIEVDGSVAGANIARISSRFNRFEIVTNAGAGDPDISLMPAAGGNVGIGNNAPAEALSISTAAEAKDNNIDFLVSNSYNAGLLFRDPAGGRGSIISNTDNDLIFSTNGTGISAETMRIDSDGNVGIGTATPDDALTIVGTSADFSVRKADNGLAARIAQFNAGGAQLRLYDSGSNETIRLAGDGSNSFITGNVGIGTTSPSSALEVRGGSIDIGTNDIKGAANSKIEMDAADGFTLTNPNNAHGIDIVADDLTFFGGGLGNRKITTNAGDLSIDPTADLLLNETAGNVGIGTDSPTERVEVSGSLLLGPRSSSPGDTMPFLKIDGYDEHGIEMGLSTWTRWRITTKVNGQLEIYNTGIQHQSQQVSIGRQNYHKQGNLLVYSTGSVLRAGHNSANYPILDIGVQDAPAGASAYRGDAYIDVRASTSTPSRFHFKRDGEFIASGVSVSGDVLGTGVGNRITNNHVPYLLSGDSPAETQTLQDVCDNGNTTTTSIISTGPYISGVTGYYKDTLRVGDGGFVDFPSEYDTLQVGTSSSATNGHILVRGKESSITFRGVEGSDKAHTIKEDGGTLTFYGDSTLSGTAGNARFAIQTGQSYFTDLAGVRANGKKPQFYLASIGGGASNKATHFYQPANSADFRIALNGSQHNGTIGTDAFAIKSTYEVGVGTVDPRAALHVDNGAGATTGFLVENSSNKNILWAEDNESINARSTFNVYHTTVSSRYLKLGWGSIFANDNGNELTLGSNYSSNSATRIFVGAEGATNVPANTIQMQANYGLAVFSGVSTDTFDPTALLDVRGDAYISGSVEGTGAGNRITNNGVPYLLSGDSPAETQNLDQVLAQGNTSTRDMSVADISGSGLFLSGAGSAGPEISLQGTYTTWEIENQYAGGANNDMFRIRNTALADDALVINRGNNKLGVGATNPLGQLHVRSANAGSFTYDTNADDLIVESNANGGITIATAAANTSRVIFASPDDATGGEISFNQTAKLMKIGPTTANGLLALQSANGVETMRLDASNNVGIGTTAPAAKLELLGKQMITVGANASPQTEDYLYIGGDGLAGADAAIYIGNRGNGSGYGWRMFYEGTGSGVNNKLKFKSENLGSPVDVITMLQDGKVGIGATAPSVGLQLGNSASGETKTAIFNSEGGAEIGLTIKSRTNRAKLAVSDNDTTAYVVAEGTIASFGKADTAASTNISVLTDGSVGIGSTSPTRLLTLENDSATVTNNSQLRINNAGAGDAYIYLFAGSDWSLGIDNSDSDKFKLCTTNDVSDGTEVVTVDRSGNVGIGTTSPSNALDVVGHFSATSKSFLINHPTKENKKLQYASLEGPENGVYVRGTTDKETIELPEYWSELVHEDSITVVLTPIGKKQDLFIKEKSNKLIKIGGAEGSFDYVVYGERKDIDKLEIEPLKV